MTKKGREISMIRATSRGGDVTLSFHLQPNGKIFTVWFIFKPMLGYTEERYMFEVKGSRVEKLANEILDALSKRAKLGEWKPTDSEIEDMFVETIKKRTAYGEEDWLWMWVFDYLRTRAMFDRKWAARQATKIREQLGYAVDVWRER